MGHINSALFFLTDIFRKTGNWGAVNYQKMIIRLLEEALGTWRIAQKKDKWLFSKPDTLTKVLFNSMRGDK